MHIRWPADRRGGAGRGGGQGVAISHVLLPSPAFNWVQSFFSSNPKSLCVFVGVGIRVAMHKHARRASHVQLLTSHVALCSGVFDVHTRHM